MDPKDLTAIENWTKADWQKASESSVFDGRLFVAGERRAADGEATFETVNPADKSVVANVARASVKDVDDAVAAAKEAFYAGIWSRMEPRDRAAVLYRFADLIEANAAELCLMDTLEMGKPIADMVYVDIPEVTKTIRYFGEAIDKVTGTTTATGDDVLHYTLRQPLGVVGAISPWNYPLMMAVWKIAPVLAAGNSVVLKPSEEASLSCLRMGDLFMEAGGPAGVFNVLSGYGAEAGEALALHMDVAKITFTGSTATGRRIMAYAGQSNLKQVGLECGGKSPQVFCADLPDMDRAVQAAIDGIYANMGEVCNAGSRLLVDRKIYGAFIERFQSLAGGSYQPGDPLDPATKLGPLVSHAARDRVEAMTSKAEEEGARVVFREEGGTANPDGAYVGPIAFADVTSDMTIAQEEVFGPVVAIMPFDTLEEAVVIANDSPYGLAAGVWTGNLSAAHKLVRDIETGVVWVNTFDDGDMTQPFGGWKQSGNARDKCFESLLAYTQSKSAWIRL